MAGRLEALEKVREAERRVQEEKAQAEKEQERLLRLAKGEALTLREDLQGKAEERSQEILRKARTSIQKEREGILQQGQAEAARIRDEVKGKMGRAVDLLLQRFEEAVHAPA